MNDVFNVFFDVFKFNRRTHIKCSELTAHSEYRFTLMFRPESVQ